MTRLLIALLVVVGIQGDAVAAGVARPKAVFAKITLGADSGLDGIRQAANAVAPGAGGMLTGSMITGALGVATSGLDATGPLHVLYVNGATSAGFVAFGKVGDTGALPASAVVKKKWALLGDPELTTLVSKWAFSALTGKVPAELVATVYPDSMITSLDLPALRTQVVGLAGGSGASLGQLFDGIVGVATDTLSVTIRIDASADRLGLVTTVTPKAKTKLAELVRAQKPADFTQFKRLADGPAAYLLGARITAGPYRTGLLSLAQQLITSGSAGTVVSYDALLGAMTGEAMLAASGSATTGVQARGLYGLLDPKAAETATKEIHAAMAQASTANIGGVSTTTVAVPGLTSHDGVTIRAYETTTTPAVGPAVQRTHFAVVDNYIAFVTDGDAPRTIDAARNKGTSLKVSATQQALFDLATARQDSLAMTLDLGATLGSSVPIPLPAGSDILVSVGFKNRAMQLYVAAPVAIFKKMAGVP